MMLKFLLALRNNAQEVEVVKLPGATRPVLGTAHPAEEERRLAVLRRWGQSAQSPRPQRLASIDEALPQRTQTILSHRVDPALRERLNSGMGPAAGSRKASLSGAPEKAQLSGADVDEPDNEAG